jgi:hypothetical protein
MKKLSIFSLAFFILVLFIFFLWKYSFFPFATASSSPAFLETTFEMSLPETQRALAKNTISLTDNVNVVTKELGHYPIFSDAFNSDAVEKASKIKHWYMHPVQMFNSTVVAEFNFLNNKLIDVEVLFEPTVAKNSALTISAIENNLNKKATFINKEFSNKVKGAYSIEFKNKKSIFELWINQVTWPNYPVITLKIDYEPYLSYSKELILERESKAF